MADRFLNICLRHTIKHLKRRVDELLDYNGELAVRNAELVIYGEEAMARIAALEARNADLLAENVAAKAALDEATKIARESQVRLLNAQAALKYYRMEGSR